MTEPLPRDDVIELLNRLGSEQDEDVLKAAREIHARITAAGASWEELLVPDEAAADHDDDDDDADDDNDDADDADDGDDDYRVTEDETGAPPTETTAGTSAKNAESLVLIEKLLALPSISSDLREELAGYKTDIAEGEFESRDHNYLRAIHKRLSKRR